MMIITNWIICLCVISCASVQYREELLAQKIYNTGAALVPYAADMEVKKANASQAIHRFRDVIKRFPHTDYADLSYVQLGLCHEYLEQWEKAEKAYEALIQKYTDEKGKPMSPYSENVRQALQFAKDRMHRLRMYRLPLIAQAS